VKRNHGIRIGTVLTSTACAHSLKTDSKSPVCIRTCTSTQQPLDSGAATSTHEAEQVLLSIFPRSLPSRRKRSAIRVFLSHGHTLRRKPCRVSGRFLPVRIVLKGTYSPPWLGLCCSIPKVKPFGEALFGISRTDGYSNLRNAIVAVEALVPELLPRFPLRWPWGADST